MKTKRIGLFVAAVLWAPLSYGQIGVIGNGPNQLDAPYDAKEIGDFVGITPPFGSFFGKD